MNDGFFSPLSRSIAHRADIISELLIQHGADINETDPQGNSFLMEFIQVCCNYRWSIEHPDAPIQLFNAIDYLVKHGIKVNHVNLNGETALLIAAKRNVPIIPYLLKNGADLNVSNLNQLLFYSIQNGEVYSVQLLLEKGASATTGLYYLLNKIYLPMNEECAKKFFFLFLEHGANINQLHLLENNYSENDQCQMIRLSLIKLMLDNGAMAIDTEIENVVPEGDRIFKADREKHNLEVSNLVKNYQPRIMSLKQLSIMSIFNNPEHLPKNTGDLPTNVSNLLKGVGEEPDTNPFPNDKTSLWGGCNIQ